MEKTRVTLIDVVFEARWGIVLQDPYLFTGTIASNVGLNNESIQPETIKEALIKVGGGHLLTKSDKGLDYEVKEKDGLLFRGTPTDFICQSDCL